MKRLQHFKELTVTDNIKLGNTLSIGGDKASVRIDNNGTMYFKDTDVGEVSLRFLQTLASTNATSKLLLANDIFTIGNTINQFSVDVTSQGDFTILQNGNMGFGTLLPTSKFHFISETIGDTFLLESTVSDTIIKFNSKDKYNITNTSGRITSGWTYNNNNDVSGSYLTFDTYINRDSTTNHDMIIKKGQVGINVEEPSDTLDVNGSASIRDKLSFNGSSCNIQEVGNQLIFFDSTMSNGYKLSDFKNLYDDLSLLASDPILTKIKDVNDVITFDSSNNFINGNLSIGHIDSKISFDNSYDFSVTGYNGIIKMDQHGMRIPRGSTAMRPNHDISGDTIGYIRYNTSINRFEGYESGSWTLMSGPTTITDIDGDTGITVDSDNFDDTDRVTISAKNQKMIVADGSNNHIEIYNKFFFTDSSGTIGNNGTNQVVIQGGSGGINFKDYQGNGVFNIDPNDKASFYGTLETTQRLQTLDDIFILGDTINMSHEKQQIKVIDNSNNVFTIQNNHKQNILTMDTYTDNEVIRTNCDLDISGNLDISGAITIKGAFNLPGNMTLGSDLDVSGSSLFRGDIDLSNKKKVIDIYDNSDNALVYKNNGNDFIKFDTTSGNENVIFNQNIGINKKPESVIPLDISGTGAMRLPVGTTNERPDLYNNDGLIRYNTTTRHIEGFANHLWINLDVDAKNFSTGPKIQSTNNDCMVFTQDTNFIEFYTNSNKRMVVNDQGKVGIGIDDPQYLLDVNGNMIVTGGLLCSSHFDVSGTTNIGGPLGINNSYTQIDHTNGNTLIGGTLDISGTLHTKNNTIHDLSANFLDKVYIQNEAKLYSNLITDGVSNLNGGINVSSGQFTVIHTSGDTTVKGITNLEGQTNTAALTSSGEVNINNTAHIKDSLNVNGDKLNIDHVTGNTHIGGELDISGQTYINNGLLVTGMTNLNGGLKCDTSRFVIHDTTGNTEIAGTLDVTGVTTLDDNLTVNGNTQLASLNVTGISSLNGDIDINSGKLNIYANTGAVVSQGGFQTTSLTSTNSLNVANNSTINGNNSVVGNETVGGTLFVPNRSSLYDVDISNNLFVIKNTDLSGNLDVSGNVEIDGTVLINNKVGVGGSNNLYDMNIVGDLNVTNKIYKNGVEIAVDSSGNSSVSYWNQNVNDISYTTGNVGIGTSAPTTALDISGVTTIRGHILPSQNAQYDLGSAEYKIRHLFLSDNSLWIGDEHKIDTQGGKMRFKKRNKNKVPKSIIDIHGGDATLAEQTVLDTIFGMGHAKTLNDMTLDKWLQFAKLKDVAGKGIGNAEIEDIYNNTSDDFEAQIEALTGIVPATDTVLGGVKVGTTIKVDANGVIDIGDNIGTLSKSGNDLYYDGGYMTIGSNTIDYPLDIRSKKNWSGTGGYLDSTGTTNTNTYTDKGISLYSDGAILSNDNVIVSSDRRIKTDVNDPSPQTIIDVVKNIETKEYHYIDPIKKNRKKTIGFIAQNVMEHLPNAVHKVRKTIPDELREIVPFWDISDNLIYLRMDNLDISDNHTGNCRFYVKDASDQSETILDINVESDHKSFRFDKTWDRVYLWGKEVDDFHVLDKAQIFAMDHCAMRELINENIRIKEENSELRERMTKLEEKMDYFLTSLGFNNE